MHGIGHRVLGMRQSAKDAQAVFAKILRDHGLDIAGQFEAGPSHQVLFTDGTVLCVLPDDVPLPATALTLDAQDARASAEAAATALKAVGHHADVLEPVSGFVVVPCSSATDNGSWMLGFRGPDIADKERRIILPYNPDNQI